MNTPELARKIGVALKPFTIQAELAAKTPLADPSADAAAKPSINTANGKSAQSRKDITQREALNLLLITAAITQKALLAAELFPSPIITGAFNEPITGAFNAAATGQPNPFEGLQQRNIGAENIHAENIHQAIAGITEAYSATVSLYQTGTAPIYTTALNDAAKLAQNPARVERMKLDRMVGDSAIDTIADGIITRAFEKQARIEARQHLAYLGAVAAGVKDTKNDDRKGGQGGLSGAVGSGTKVYPRQKNPAP